MLAELRRQLKPLQQQAEMAKKHETLTEQAEELSRKLAAARLRALLREKERRKDGWDRGLEERKSAPGAARQPRRAGAAGSRRSRRRRPRAGRCRAGVPRRAGRADGADRAFRSGVEREATARENLAAEASRTARLDGVDRELARAEQELARVITELEAARRELDRAEQEFRRRRSIAARSKTSAAHGRGSGRPPRRDGGAPPEPSSSERERERLDVGLRDVADRIQTLEHERETVEADVERVDGRTSPLADRLTELEQERRGSIEKIEELEDVERRHRARIDLSEARRRDIEETAGSRFLRRTRGERSACSATW